MFGACIRQRAGAEGRQATLSSKGGEGGGVRAKARGWGSAPAPLRLLRGRGAGRGVPQYGGRRGQGWAGGLDCAPVRMMCPRAVSEAC